MKKYKSQIKIRQSNIELLRIFCMIIIITCHFIGFSTVSELYNENYHTFKQYFTQLCGMWGKTAINTFILISGYFLCDSKLTPKRYLKLVLQIYYYIILLTLVFQISGYETFSIKNWYYALFSPIREINNGFIASFLCFYAGVPVYNIVIKNTSKHFLTCIISFLLLLFSISSTIFNAPTMNEPFWYMTLYFIASYLKLYPNRFTNSLNFSIIFFLAGVIISIVWCYYLASINYDFFAYPVIDSNKLCALIVGSGAFLIAKNSPIFYNKSINFLASGTFGALLLHSGTTTIRQWLWKDFIDLKDYYYLPTLEYILFILFIPIIIFMIGSIFDWFRRVTFEKYILNYLENKNILL